MKNFYCHVDLRSRKQMTGFLKNHFRYPSLNSWNYSTSYACDLKIHSLGLDADLTDRLYDMLELQEFFSVQKELLYEFGKQHRFLWQACMNGRSGGYLVLYQGEMRESGYQSYCTCCGQKNYRKYSPRLILYSVLFCFVYFFNRPVLRYQVSSVSPPRPAWKSSGHTTSGNYQTYP